MKYEESIKDLETAFTSQNNELQHTIHLLRLEYDESQRIHASELDRERKNHQIALENVEKSHHQKMFETEKKFTIIQCEMGHHEAIKVQLEETIERQRKSYM